MSIFYESAREYHVGMATIHISEADAVRDFAKLLAKVHSGNEVVIDGGAMPIVIQAAYPKPRTLQEVLALIPRDSPPVDDDFAKDVAEARTSLNQPIDGSAWD